jgi:hypothetical protein
MPQFLLILHEDPGAFKALSPTEMQAVVDKYRQWSQALAVQGQLAGGQKLRDEGGRHLRRSRGELQVTNGPYAEAKDVIGGYFVVEAAGYDEAQRLAAGCPHLGNGWIELREIEPT